MTNGQGLYWASLDELTGSSPDTINEDFGAPGNWYSYEELNTTIGTTKLSTDNFDKFAFKGFASGLSDIGGGPNGGVEVCIWGVMGFGEYLSNQWLENKVMTLRLFSFNYNRANDTKTSVDTVVTSPSGQTLTSHSQDHCAWSAQVFSSAGGYNGGIFAALSEMRPVTNDSPDTDSMYVGASNISTQGASGGNGGVMLCGGLGVFPELRVAANLQGHSASAVNLNLSYARVY